MYDNEIDREFLAYVKEVWEEFLNPDDISHLEIRDKLENDKAILYFVVDSRYGKDFSGNYFYGKFAYWGLQEHERREYYYNKEKSGIYRIGKDIPGFTQQQVNDFYFPRPFGEGMKLDVKRTGCIEYEHLEHIFVSVGGEKITGLPLPSKENKAELQTPIGRIFDASLPETARKLLLAEVLKRFEEIGIRYRIENDTLYIAMILGRN